MPANINTGLTLASSITLRLRHLAGCIHPLGPRPLYELMRELTAASSVALGLFEIYARIDTAVLDRYGGRELPTIIRRVK